MSETVKIVIPDAGPINTLAAPGLLHLLFAPPNTELVIIQCVLDEIISRAPELRAFMKDNSKRISVVKTSVCEDVEGKRRRGEPIGKGRGDLAIADFIMNHIDDAIGNSPALVIYEDSHIARLHTFGEYSEKTHFITTAAYVRKLEEEGIIGSFENTWKQIVDANYSPDPKVDRKPNPREVEKPTPRGSLIFRRR